MQYGNDNGNGIGPAPHKTILIVDDDLALRKSMRDFLTQSGYRVLEAGNAYDALYHCAQSGRNIHMLLTEVNLLPVGGIKLAENVLRLWPHLQVLCMSQRISPEAMKYWLSYLRAEYLEKPFTPQSLHQKVRGLIGDESDELMVPAVDDSWTHFEHAGPENPLFWLNDNGYV